MPARNLTSLDTTNMQSTELRRIRQSYMLELGGGGMGRQRGHGYIERPPSYVSMASYPYRVTAVRVLSQD